MTSFELLICFLLISISAYMSSSEIALFSLSRFQLRALKEHLRPSVHRKIKRLLSDPGGLLVTILFINEVVNVALSALIAKTVSRMEFGDYPLLRGLPHWVVDVVLGTLVTAPILLFFCEITPKVIGAKANQLIASLTAEPMSLTYGVLKPVRSALTHMVSLFSRWANATPAASEKAKGEDILKESDFLLMVEEGHKEGAIHESEMELIRRVFELDDTTVAEVYKPLTQVQTLTAVTTIKTALTAVRTQSFSRIPVVSSTRKVVGILYLKDLLQSKLDPDSIALPISGMMRKPLFVSATLRLNSLFRKLKQEQTHLAVVLSETGETLGIVTMADVLNALFEEVLDEEES